ncbi:M20/M25/M40 family metallo-hydrolase [Alicyclobacillus contaminans]|uniref:M20/M25/M40 family metallo-hydrolase n=1 Tax=Alicyclobacillus contaminans TaxID=392016 RepID=UPI000414DEBD|nr:M20/M25/M40 family metallo-hydrolase [Alicyclobacillus contaminans]
MKNDTRPTARTHSDAATEAVQRLMGANAVRAALAFAETDHARTVEDQIRLTEIPAPTFHEHDRGQAFLAELESLGLSDVKVDATGNVYGVRKGAGRGPTVFVSAHLDTVFPEGTDTEVRQRNGVLYAPGIADDGRGLAVVLAVLRALNHANVQTVGDLWFGATVGEEGLGDLRGVKAFFDENQVDGFISVEPDAPNRITYLATGSHRYRITFRGPGGHSFGDFGTPSAIHAMGRAIAAIADLEVPENPKTTFTVGVVRGGTSINTIAAEAEMMVDIRSDSEPALLALESNLLACVHEAVSAENARWNQQGIQVSVELVGNRPAGQQSVDSPAVQNAMAAIRSLGFMPSLDEPSSTDANVPIHLGVPAVTLGGGGRCGGIHTLQEFYHPEDGHHGVQVVLLTALAMVGVSEVSEPTLSVSPSRA